MMWVLGERRLDFGARAHVMGILNATPDSFYDGGRYLDAEAAVARGLEMLEEGADIIDVGGESSRPPLYGPVRAVDAEEECRRVLPVIEALRRHTSAPISIDTVKAEVARRALDAGADIVNDISALADERMAAVAAAAAAPVVLMHGRGAATARGGDLLGTVRAYLQERIAWARARGIEQVAVDPGLGFGKSIAGNLGLVRHLRRLADLGCPLLVGASRKSFVWKTLGLSVDEGLEGSLALAALSRCAGAHIVRTHDVLHTCRVLRMTDAVLGADIAA